MPTRKANAVWEGNLKEGKGSMKFGAGAFDGAYSFSSRFEEGAGTNPEELIGAAHAGCFSMFLAGELGRAGKNPKRVETEAKVLLEKGDVGFSIRKIILTTKADVPGMDAQAFQAAAEASKIGCPVSRALTGAEIEVRATLA